MDARILIVSAVRNEMPHIERVLRSIAEQTLAPAKMVVIDDGSSDGTFEVLEHLEAEIGFLTLIRAAPRLGGPDRLALAIEAANFNSALGLVHLDQFTHVMKLDGDIELPPSYLHSIVSRLDADPRLGLAGGVLVEPTPDGRLREIIIPRHHVHGALKLYSRACFESIGGIQERLGWDTIDETYARMRGFSTRSFTDIVAIHHKPLAAADGVLRGRARHGECAWILHYSPLWVLLRSLKVAVAYRPTGVSGLAFLYGYLRAAVTRTEQVPDRSFRRFTRNELRRRLWAGVFFGGRSRAAIAGRSAVLRARCVGNLRSGS